jgi:hypothetical protein
MTPAASTRRVQAPRRVQSANSHAAPFKLCEYRHVAARMARSMNGPSKWSESAASVFSTRSSTVPVKDGTPSSPLLVSLNASAARARRQGTSSRNKQAKRNAGNVSSMASQGHRPPLTRQQLQSIGERYRGNVDVRALLWEIHRLRAVELRADQLVRSLPGRSVGSLGFIADAAARSA